MGAHMTEMLSVLHKWVPGTGRISKNLSCAFILRNASCSSICLCLVYLSRVNIEHTKISDIKNSGPQRTVRQTNGLCFGVFLFLRGNKGPKHRELRIEEVGASSSSVRRPSVCHPSSAVVGRRRPSSAVVGRRQLSSPWRGSLVGRVLVQLFVLMPSFVTRCTLIGRFVANALPREWPETKPEKMPHKRMLLPQCCSLSTRLSSCQSTGSTHVFILMGLQPGLSIITSRLEVDGKIVQTFWEPSRTSTKRSEVFPGCSPLSQSVSASNEHQRENKKTLKEQWTLWFSFLLRICLTMCKPGAL